MTARRFPSPRPVEEQPACFVVRDQSGQALAYDHCQIASTNNTTITANMANPIHGDDIKPPTFGPLDHRSRS